MIENIRIKNIVDIVGSSVKQFSGERIYISTGDASEELLQTEKAFTFNNKPQRANLEVSETDIIVAKMKNTNKTIHIKNPMQEFIYSTGFYALNTKKINNRYLYYLLSCDEFVSWKDAWSLGTTQMSLNNDHFKYIYVTYINDAEKQQQIADYLDDKISIINSELEKNIKSIGLFEEYRNSLYCELLSCGINCNNSVKSNVIKWLERINPNYDIYYLKNITKENKDKNKKLECNNLLSLSYGQIIKKDIESNFGLLPESFDTYQIVKQGMTIMRLTDLQNDKKSLRTGYVNDSTGIITSAYLGLIPQENKVIPIYLHKILHSYDLLKVFYTLGDGVRQSLGYKDLKYLPIILPPIEEQKEIADYLDNKCELIDKVINYRKQIIEKLEEYKKSLIYEVVTGKVEV